MIVDINSVFNSKFSEPKRQVSPNKIGIPTNPEINSCASIGYQSKNSQKYPNFEVFDDAINSYF